MPDAATRRKFEALVAAAFADGFLAEAEKVVLQQKADRMGLSTREMHEIIGLGQQRKLSVGIPSTAPERETLLDDLIDVCGADGRVEAPEYSLLARFAETLKISLPDLRLRVNRRMQGVPDRGTRIQTRRESPPPPPASAPRRDPAPPASPPPAPEGASFMKAPAPMPTPTPFSSQREFPQDPKVGDLPPVTLQLLKQSVMFDNEDDSIAAISRTLGIPGEPAAQIRRAILAAFPDLKPASQAPRQIPRP
jgi:uncharacterized tellurite resistance protein B-like protein